MDLVPVNPAGATAIGQFAVDDENKKRPIKLTFDSMVHAFKGSVVEGKIYPLIIKILDGNGKPFEHKALVLQKSDGILNLINYWE